MLEPISLPKVVIVGGGFGGLRAAQKLKRTPASVTLIDKNNYHLFQPLLYQVATAGLSPAEIAMPIRHILRRQKNVKVLMAEVSGVDIPKKQVLSSRGPVPFDFLLLATGSQYHYFGNDQWGQHAPSLKSIPDAIAIRRKILTAFEQAESDPHRENQEALLNFVVVGGGPTGVEIAGAMAELARKALALDFKKINPKSARILILEEGPRILAGFPQPLSKRAERSLERLGVEVRCNALVETVDAQGVIVGNKRIAAKTVLWCAGVEATPIAKWLGVEADRGGRVRLKSDLSVPGHPNIFVVGDAAHVPGPSGDPLPGIAPVAKQQGNYVGKLLSQRIQTGESPSSKPFCYVDKGNLATIGRSSAVADLHGFHLSGWLGWVFWLLVHITYLIGFRNRLLVLVQWAWSYLTFQRGARLITESEAPSTQTEPVNTTMDEPR